MSWKTIRSKEVYKNKWMTVSEEEGKTNFGKNFLYGIVHKEPAALIIPWDGTRFTLVGQYRYPIDKDTWEFSQGHFEHGSIEETARIELKEETGISADSLKIIGTFYVAPGHHTQICKVFLAEGLTEGETNPEDSEEGMKTKKVTLNELEDMIAKGEMQDGPSLAALSIFNNFIKQKQS